MDVYLGLDNIGMSVRSTVSIIWLISNLQCMCLQKENKYFFLHVLRAFHSFQSRRW